MKTEFYYNDIVVVERGQYKGAVGLYDDDHGKKMIVYTGAPCLGEYVMVLPSVCRHATAEEVLAWTKESLSDSAYLKAAKENIEASKFAELGRAKR